MSDNSRLYRLDTFDVPHTVVGELSARIEQTHATLRKRPGFIRDLVL